MESTAEPAGRTIDPTISPLLGTVPLLVGRAREQAALRDVLATVVSGRGQLVLLGGEAGIGKTTLARDLSGAATSRGCRDLAGSCYDLTNTPPYGPWRDLFEASRREPDLPAPPSAFAGGRLATVTDQAALFAEVRQFLAALTADQPALILLEDLHWADPASVDLLRHIGPHLRHWPLLLLITYRVDELRQDHPFSRQLPALVREAEGLRIDLRRLDLDALRALVSERYRLMRPDEDRLVTYLQCHAEGNPFFATELLRTLEERTLLRWDKARWFLDTLDRVFVPSLLRQVIDGRVARLGEEVRKPLSIAAVIGQEAPLALWAEVAALDEETLLDVVEQAVGAHLLAAEHDGTRVHFVHALTREALYEGVLPPRRRTWHRRVAEALLTSTDPDPDAVAYHLQYSGDPRAWEWLVRAADRAQRAYAWRTAADRLRAAVALLEGVDGEVGRRGQLLSQLAHLERFSNPAGAIAPITEAEYLAAQTDSLALAAKARYFRGLLLCYADRLRDGIATMLEGIEALEVLHRDMVRSPIAFWEGYVRSFAGKVSPPTSDDELAVLRLQRAGLDSLRSIPAWYLALAGQPRNAVASSERFLTVLAPGPEVTEGARYATAFADHGLAIAYAALGRPDNARQAWARSRAIFRDLGHHVLVAFSICVELWDRVYPYDATDPALRRLSAAEAEAALGRARGALAPGLSPQLAWLSCLVLDGRWEEALRILQDLPPPGNSCLRREITGPHATLARHRGEPEMARAQIRPLFPDGPATEPGDLIHQEGLLLQRLAADICLDVGDLVGAQTWLEAHDAWLAWSESILGRADGQLVWARWYRATGEAARAHTAATEALALAAVPRQPLVCLAAHRLLGEIETASNNHAAAEAHLTIALDLAIACEAPFERALTLLSLAELRLTMGKSSESARFLDDVRAICEPLGAAPTLARADALAARLTATRHTGINAAGLTPRELDVLRLVVAGRSNLEIAEALFISRDTARTHVSNIFRKLDVRTRAEAVDHAHRHGLLSSLPSAST
jgi:DNA-binding CsgD family transcriptional regulator